MNRDIVGQVLRDYVALRCPDGDAGLEAVRAAILVEDVFGVGCRTPRSIRPCWPPAAVAALVARLGGVV